MNTSHTTFRRPCAQETAQLRCPCSVLATSRWMVPDVEQLHVACCSTFSADSKQALKQVENVEVETQEYGQ
jgi:hypothetical protein